jgi:hypothetical protein
LAGQAECPDRHVLEFGAVRAAAGNFRRWSSPFSGQGETRFCMAKSAIMRPMERATARTIRRSNAPQRYGGEALALSILFRNEASFLTSSRITSALATRRD